LISTVWNGVTLASPAKSCYKLQHKTNKNYAKINTDVLEMLMVSFEMLNMVSKYEKRFA